jgi:hypothetical protein
MQERFKTSKPSQFVLLGDDGSYQFVNLSDNEFANESARIVEAATAKGITLRIVGGLGVYFHILHSQEGFRVFSGLERLGTGKSSFADLDLMGERKEAKNIDKFLVKELGFTPNRYVNAFFGDRRLIFQNVQKGFKVDVFLDKLEYSHNVHFSRQRLLLDSPTVGLADLVLGKAQIHDVNNKDLLDLLILFLVHEVAGDQAPERVDGGYIARILSEDWGFCYDAVKNLTSTIALAQDCLLNNKLRPGEAATVTERVGRLISMIDKHPKTAKWKERERVGTAKPWYQEVEEVQR